MPSKRRPVGDSLIGATINFVGATPRKREEGRAGVFRYGENFGDFLLTPRAGRASPAPTRTRNPRARASEGGRFKSSATDEVTEEFFDARLFARVILLGNGAGLLAQLQTKHFFLQRVQICGYRFLDVFAAGLLLCRFGGGFFRLRGSSALALLHGHHDNFIARQQN